MRILHAVLVLSVVAPRASAQVWSDTICVASHAAWGGAGNRLWPDDKWQAGQDTLPRGVAWVTDRLSGEYRLLEIATEGYGPAKRVREWRVTLAKPNQDSAALWGTRMGQKVYEVPVAGTKVLVREGTLGGSVANVKPDTRSRMVEPVRINYRGRDRLMLQSGPYNLVDGNFVTYSIAEVDERGSFAGRWSSGGYGVGIFETNVGALGESEQGYYCAFRK